MGAEIGLPAFVRLLECPLCGCVCRLGILEVSRLRLREPPVGVSNRGPDVKEAAFVAKDVVPEFLSLVQFCCRGQVNSFRDVLAPPLILAACLYGVLGILIPTRQRELTGAPIDAFAL